MGNSLSLIFKYVISLLLEGQSRAYQTSFYQEKDDVRLVADSFFLSFFFFPSYFDIEMVLCFCFWGIIGIQHYISFRYTTQWFNIWIYFKMIITVSVVNNIIIHSYKNFFSCGEDFEDLLS